MLKKPTHKKQEDSQLTLFKAVQKPEKVKKVKVAKKVRKDPQKKTPLTSKKKVVKKTSEIKKVQKSTKKQLKRKKTLPPLTTKKKRIQKKLPPKAPFELRVWSELVGEKDTLEEKDFFLQFVSKKDALDLMREVKKILSQKRRKK